jgi:hypothetical protein
MITGKRIGDFPKKPGDADHEDHSLSCNYVRQNLGGTNHILDNLSSQYPRMPAQERSKRHGERFMAKPC